MDFSKIAARFSGIKIKPNASIVIIESMVFLFSIESLIEMFNIHPILCFVIFLVASLSVFIVLHYIKQNPEEKSWLSAVFNRKIFAQTLFSLLFLILFFGAYIELTRKDYRIITIASFSSDQKDLYEKIKAPDSLALLSKELKSLIGETYSLKIIQPSAQNKTKGNYRVIVVPGIFDRHEALLKVKNLEEHVAYLLSQKEEREIPCMCRLWKKYEPRKLELKEVIPQIHLLAENDEDEYNPWNQFWNRLKYTINVDLLY